MTHYETLKDKFAAKKEEGWKEGYQKGIEAGRKQNSASMVALAAVSTTMFLFLLLGLVLAHFGLVTFP